MHDFTRGWNAAISLCAKWLREVEPQCERLKPLGDVRDDVGFTHCNALADLLEAYKGEDSEDTSKDDDWNSHTASAYERQKAKWDAQPEEVRLLIDEAFEVGQTLGRLEACTFELNPTDKDAALRVLPKELEGPFWDNARKLLATELFKQRIRTTAECLKKR